MAQILAQAAVRKTWEYVVGRRHHIIGALRRRVGAARIARAMRQRLDRDPEFVENKLRSSFVLAAGLKCLAGRYQERSKDVLLAYCRDTAELHHMREKFGRTIHLVTWIQRRCRACLSGRRAQLATLRQMFAAEKDKMVLQLMLHGQKKKKDPDGYQAFLEALRPKLLALDEAAATFVLFQYLDACRSVFWDSYEEIRQLKLSGTATGLQRVLVNSFGADLSVGSSAPDVSESLLPAEFRLVQRFEQLQLPGDMSLRPKAWRQVRTYLDKHFPNHAKESKRVLEDIAQFRAIDVVHDLMVTRSFLFVPTEALVHLLVLKAAL